MSSRLDINRYIKMQCKDELVERKESQLSWEHSEVRFWGFFQIIWFNNKPQISGWFSATKSHYVWPNWSPHPIIPECQAEKAVCTQNWESQCQCGAISWICCVTMVVPLTLSELLRSWRDWLYMGARKEEAFSERFFNYCDFLFQGKAGSEQKGRGDILKRKGK